jgi:hypothetical protein
LDDLSHTELKNLVVALFEQVVELRRTTRPPSLHRIWPAIGGIGSVN